MPRRSLFLLLAAVALGTLAYGAVPIRAWFDGTWSTAGSIITSGSLALDVTGGPLRAPNLKPGHDPAPLGRFCLRNTGSLPLKYRGQFEAAAPITHALLQYATLRVEQHTTGPWALVHEIPGGALPAYFRHPGQAAEVVNPFVVAGDLAAGERRCYRLSIWLDPHTPDTEQGQAVDFVLHLDATQPDNPAW